MCRKNKDEKPKKFPDISFKNGNGIEYTIVWRAPHPKWRALGLCDPPDCKDPQIWIDPGLEKYELIEIICHEICHAFFFDQREKDVTRFAKIIKKIVKKII